MGVQRGPDPRLLTVFSSVQNLTYSVQSDSPWIEIAPASEKRGARRFKVGIDPTKVQPGRNEGLIRIQASGLPESQVLTIPVVVEVPRIR